MNSLFRLIFIFFILTLYNLISPRDACAYLDPGTGSYFLQIIIAALVGSLFAVKLFWNKIKGFFRNVFTKSGDREET